MNYRPRAVFLSLFLLLFAAAAWAQTTANLTGTVTAEGKALPGATVTITSPNLQGTRTAYSDVNGNYNFGSLPPGDYRVSFELAGMQTVTRQVHVALSQTARADAELRVQATSDVITVTAAPAVVETTEIQTNISQSTVERLPLSRTLLGTVDIAPGTTQNGPAGATMISGAPSFDNTFYMDGSVINEVLRGQPQNLFIEDAIQETTVQSGAISAEFGRFTGGVVTAISKSGGNDYTGSLRDTLTNPRWTAQTPAGEPRPDSDLQNRYEATFGGRIIKDRLWFFTAGRYRKLDQQNSLLNQPTKTFNFSDKERRLQGKLTGQIGSNHTIVGTYLDIKQDQLNNCFGGCYETSVLDSPRSLPNSFATIDYNGIFSKNFLVEASYAKQNYKFVGGGSFVTGDPATSTFILTTGGNLLGAAPFCNDCSAPEERPNRNAKIKGSYFWSPAKFGTHNLTAGYEDFQDQLKSNNHQSPSDFEILAFREPTIQPDGTVTPIIRPGGALIVWWPIIQASLGNKFTTRSLFLNDKWDLSQHLTFNLGARYDKNTGINEAHNKVADDSLLSPRLGLIFDPFGTGRLRLNASYSIYSSKIANGNIGDATSAAGQPSLEYWVYAGPTITGLNSTDTLRQIFSWFNSVGGVKNLDFLAGGGTAGVSTQIPNGLESPSVRELTFGLGGNISPRLFLRADYQNRRFRNFYTTVTNASTGKVFDPLLGFDVDLSYLVNSNDLRRTYNAIILQGGYQPLNKLNIGANYTFSKLRGNVVGETGGSGPVPTGGPNQFPEFQGFAQNNPIGYLGADQRHKLRAWATYDLPTTRFGTFNVGLLQRFDSGTPYSLVGTIEAQPNPSTNPDYVLPPQTVNYFFSRRGQFRTDDITRTDLSLNYFHPLARAELFVESQVLNVFNRHGRVNVNTDILTSASDPSLQPFNPFTDTPVEGVNWAKDTNFGKALNAGDYQLARSYRFSVGLRF